MTIDSFLDSTRAAAALVRTMRPEQVVLLHHNDADGIATGAILSRAFERTGCALNRYCLEKPYPWAVEMLLSDPELPDKTLFVFGDFASGMLPTIRDLNVRGFRYLVLDHHSIAPADDPRGVVVNCRQHGISGDSECCAASVSAMFASALDPVNEDSTHLALLGAVGDSQNVNGSFAGINGILADRARATGRLRSGDALELRTGEGDWIGVEELVGHVNALGGIGYFKGGSDVALKGVLEGFDGRYVYSADQFEERYRAALDSLIASSAINSSGSFDLFDLGAGFDGMGVKTVGLVCEDLLARGVVRGDRYVVGFQKLPPFVPGLPPRVAGTPQVKVSLRVGELLRPRVEAGALPSLLELVPAAVGKIGGFVDACHKFAGAAVIDVGMERGFVEEMERVVEVRVV